MMKTKMNFLKYGLMVLTIVFASCAKDGEIGPVGSIGPAGQNGVNGTDGTDGNANVIASSWTEIGVWTGNGTQFAYADKAAPEITQEVIDNSVVLAYIKLDGDSNFVRPLPADIASGEILWNFLIKEVGTIRYTVSSLAGVTASSSNQVRYVIIPSSTTSKSAGVNFKKMSYKETMDYFGLNY